LGLKFEYNELVKNRTNVMENKYVGIGEAHDKTVNGRFHPHGAG
jgi:hypothetical protein